jgi:hypothetical protein
VDDGETDLSGLRESNRAEFDRALAAHDRDVAAKAWGEGWNTGWDGRMLHDQGLEGHAEEPNPYISALMSEPSTPELLERARAEAANDAFVDAVAWARSCSGESADVAADYIQEMYTRTPSTPEGEKS